MKILALDTSATVATVALTEDLTPLAEYTLNNGNTHSETLLPMIESMLKALSLKISDVDLFALSAGPGSFTGVRIGAATIKGLAFSRQKHCVGVSTIEALYENLADYGGIVCPIMNARRGQVYTGAFLDGKRILDDTCMMLDDLIPMLEKTGAPIRFNGDGYDLVKGREIVGLKEAPELLRYQNAYSVGRVALRKIKEGKYTTDEALRVEYLRKPQAEREREERLGGKNG